MKKGDIAHRVISVSTAIASNDGSSFAGFSFSTENGDVNLCMTAEQTAMAVSGALNMLSELASRQPRRQITSGLVKSIDAVPESMTVSHLDSNGIAGTRIVAIFGSAAIAFHIDRGLAASVASSMAGPKGPIARVRNRSAYVPKGTTVATVPDDTSPKYPNAISPLDDRSATYLGNIAILWGQLQYEIDEYINRLSKVIVFTRESGLELTRNVKTLLQIARIFFVDNNVIIKYTEDMTNRILAAWFVRNALFHGMITSPVNNDGKVELMSNFRSKGSPVQALFTEDSIICAYMEISNILGLLRNLAEPEEDVNFPQSFTSGDFVRLRSVPPC